MLTCLATNVGCLRHFAYSKFRIFRMFFWGFVYHSKMAPISRNYTKIFLTFFYANLYKIPRYFEKFCDFLKLVYFSTIRTDDIFYTQQRHFKTLIGVGEVRQYTPKPLPLTGAGRRYRGGGGEILLVTSGFD
jgi:hypothetical protein